MAANAGRPGFREWLERFGIPNWQKLPLTHITKSILAEDIIRAATIEPRLCAVFNKPISYFFYGRPAYRVSGDGAIKQEAACPVCFVFDPKLIAAASSMYAFDTGAFSARLYKTFLLDEMNVDDFAIIPSPDAPNQLISAIFDNQSQYIEGDTSGIKQVEAITEPYEFHARAFLELVSSKGRNEPDDRVFSIEVQVEKDVALAGNLKAVVLPHTLWTAASQTPWIKPLAEMGVRIETYKFVPNKGPEYYQALIEAAVTSLYREWGMI